MKESCQKIGFSFPVCNNNYKQEQFACMRSCGGVEVVYLGGGGYSGVKSVLTLMTSILASFENFHCM